QPFRYDFRIRQDVFRCCKLSFRKEQRIRPPVKQASIEQFLRMNAGTEDPDRRIGGLPIIGWRPMPRVREYGGQKWLSRLDDVWKLHGPASILYRVKFARDGFACRDTFQKLCTD